MEAAVSTALAGFFSTKKIQAENQHGG